MRTRVHWVAMVLAVLTSASSEVGDAHGNFLTNGDFEAGLDGWQFFGDGVTDTVGLSSDTPSGVGSSADLLVVGPVGLPWLVQDVAVSAGQELVFAASVKELVPDPSDAWLAAQVWMLPNSSSGLILASSALFFTTSDWSTQQSTIEVPAGANVARVLFAIQNTSFGVGTGNYLIDNVSLAIPEPASASQLLLASVMLWRGSRRRAR